MKAAYANGVLSAFEEAGHTKWEAIYHDLRQGDIIAWLKATGRLPFASGPPVTIDGRTLLDGGILDPIPARKAVADGATELTIVLNKPPGPRVRDNAVIAGMAAR